MVGDVCDMFWDHGWYLRNCLEPDGTFFSKKGNPSKMQNLIDSTLESANPATRIRPSDVYSGTVYDRGYDGEGIVIAVLDSGVDNEHRSLNDFDDVDDEPDLDANSYNDQKY